MQVLKVLLACRLDPAFGFCACDGSIPPADVGARPWFATHNVPAACFWLVALTPLILLPFALPPLARTNRWYVRVLQAVLVFVPLLIAVIVAGQHAEMAFED